VCWQILAFASETVSDPGTENGMAGDHEATLNQVNSGFVRDVGSIERANEGDIVNMPGNIRQSVRNPHAALSVSRKFEGTAHEGACVFHILDLSRDLIEISLAVMRIQRRLRIKKIHLARAAIHEEVDHRFSPRTNMRRPWARIGRHGNLCSTE